MAKWKRCATCNKVRHGRDLVQVVDPSTGQVVDVCIDNTRCHVPYLKRRMKEGA